MGATNRTVVAVMLGLITAGCGATEVASQPTPTAQASVAPASSFAALRSRPLKLPAIAAGATCPADSSHDVHAVVTVGKGGPNFGFGPGPVYLSGIVSFYPESFDNEIWMIDAGYRGPVLIRGHQVNGSTAVSFQPPTTFAGSSFSAAGSPPPDPAVASVTIEGTALPFYSELDLPAADPSYPNNSWRLFFARTHIDAPGCYAFQLDGSTFSTVIVFHVPDAARPGG